LAEHTGSRRTCLEHRATLARALAAVADVYLLPLASGMIAGEALVAVIAAIYLAAIG
jgi:hypothetical protein